MKKIISKKQFLKEVKQEINNIKKYATKKEISKLDFEILDPQNTNNCVYGQMTGDCKSDRASSLIYKSCKTLTRNEYGCPNYTEGWNSVKKGINGETKQTYKSLSKFKEGREDITHMSFLETYILMPKAKNKKVIQYLKGKIKKLTL